VLIGTALGRAGRVKQTEVRCALLSIRRDQLKTIIDEKLAVVEIVDLHTHLFSADFDGMLLWGID